MKKTLLFAVLLTLPIVAAAAESTQPTRAAVSSVPRADTTVTNTKDVAPPTEDPQEGKTDYLLEIDGIKGESKSPSLKPIEKGSKALNEEGALPSIEPDEIDVMEDPQEASDAFLKFDGVKGESTKAPGVEPDEIDVKVNDSSATEKKKGNVEYEWKVEEGESAPPPGVEPDELATPEDPQPITPDFGILLGGGSDSGGDDDTEESMTPMEELILNGLKEEGAPVETLSLNFEKMKTTATKTVKFLGIIPIDATVTVEVDTKGETKVKFPWWAFLASGKDGDSLGEQIVTSLTNVLKNKHDQIEGLQ